MHDRKNRRIEIIIEGKDYDKFESFVDEHEDCILKYPNMTGGHFKIEAVADGFGLFKTMTCVCGKSIAFTDDYESFEGLRNAPGFQVVPEDPETDFIVKRLLHIKRRPAMFFGSNRLMSVLRIYLAGLEEGIRFSNKEPGWNHIREKLYQNFQMTMEGKTLSEEEQFVTFLDTFEATLLQDFPEYMKRFDIS